ncbi:hypothetical protein Anapl_01221 [Anas platyrhynchos]|uniref:Uncharacterized protein n=1 Tax=Anas platyrhynchos TaxID=8839 RepID=R0K7P1_ANAPL|nr:hypothetical protein Anapl_01221 [Anas platyrhynchos]
MGTKPNDKRVPPARLFLPCSHAGTAEVMPSRGHRGSPWPVIPFSCACKETQPNPSRNTALSDQINARRSWQRHRRPAFTNRNGSLEICQQGLFQQQLMGSPALPASCLEGLHGVGLTHEHGDVGQFVLSKFSAQRLWVQLVKAEPLGKPQSGCDVPAAVMTRGPHGIRARRMPGTNNHISRVAKVLLVPISSGLCGSLDHDIAAQGSDPGSGAAVLLGRLLEVATCDGEAACYHRLLHAWCKVLPANSHSNPVQFVSVLVFSGGRFGEKWIRQHLAWQSLVHFGMFFGDEDRVTNSKEVSWQFHITQQLNQEPKPHHQDPQRASCHLVTQNGVAFHSPRGHTNIGHDLTSQDRGLLQDHMKPNLSFARNGVEGMNLPRTIGGKLLQAPSTLPKPSEQKSTLNPKMGAGAGTGSGPKAASRSLLESCRTMLLAAGD